MMRNVGLLDRLLRIIIGVMILGLFGALEPPLKYVTLVGLLPLATGLSGFCPLYAVLGISTRSRSLS